jgi:hypothetical protein
MGGASALVTFLSCVAAILGGGPSQTASKWKNGDWYQTIQ